MPKLWNCQIAIIVTVSNSQRFPHSHRLLPTGNQSNSQQRFHWANTCFVRSGKANGLPSQYCAYPLAKSIQSIIEQAIFTNPLPPSQSVSARKSEWLERRASAVCFGISECIQRLHHLVQHPPNERLCFSEPSTFCLPAVSSHKSIYRESASKSVTPPESASVLIGPFLTSGICFNVCCRFTGVHTRISWHPSCVYWIKLNLISSHLSWVDV